MGVGGVEVFGEGVYLVGMVAPGVVGGLGSHRVASLVGTADTCPVTNTYTKLDTWCWIALYNYNVWACLYKNPKRKTQCTN